MARYDFQPEHYLLPVAAQALLKKAAKVEGERERQIAIEEATEKVKRQWPERFRDEEIPEGAESSQSDFNEP